MKLYNTMLTGWLIYTQLWVWHLIPYLTNLDFFLKTIRMNSSLSRLITCIIPVVIIIAGSCNNQPGNRWYDERDGEVYQYETVDGLSWMTCNLNYIDRSIYCKGAWVFSYDEREYEDALLKTRKSDSGVLYDWKTAKDVCRDGWRLPSVEEWKLILTTNQGGTTPGLGDYNMIIDGRARSYEKFCIYSGVTFWTSDLAEKNGEAERAMVAMINITADGKLETRYEDQSTEHAFYVRLVRDKSGDIKNTHY